jgi:two-component sensor histidine kinase
MIKSDLEAGVARSSITYDWNFSHRKFKQRLHIIRVSESIFFVYNEDLTLEQRALEEKSALLKELVHRVKNNFQTLDSLVALHSTRLADPEVKMHFSALRNRIFSLGAVHDHLYRTNDFSKIELNSYLGQVARNLINSHPTSKGLVLSGEVEFIVDSESASKCGAILNELLTNTFKYAFPSQRANIACYWTGKLPNSISFNYFDNGPFYQTRVHTHQGKGLGQLIINSFTESLNGHIEYQDLLKNSHEWPKALSEERSFGKKQQIFYFSLVFPERSE